MVNTPPISLSIAIVCYRSDSFELRRLITSLLEAVSQLKKGVRTQPIIVWLIDNTEMSFLEGNSLEGVPLKRALLEINKSNNNSQGITKLEAAAITLATFDDLKVQMQEQQVELKLVSGHGNIGYGSAHNLVLANVKSDYHLMLNPDICLDKQCLAEGITYLAKHDATVMATPMAFQENGERQYLCKRYPCVLTLFVRGFCPAWLQKPFAKRLASYEMRELACNKLEKSTEPVVSIISGCFMLCRTSALDAINGFDKRYFLYFEDFDLSLRMARQCKIAYVPSMQIIHGGGNAARKGLNHIFMFVRSGIRFFNSHGWRWLRS